MLNEQEEEDDDDDIEDEEIKEIDLKAKKRQRLD